MSHEIFAKLISHAARNDVAVANADKSRWIERLSSADAELMSKADTDPLILSRQMKALFLKHEGTTYFVTAGFPLSDIMPAGLMKDIVTPGIFSTSVLSLDMDPNSTGYGIRDAIEDLHDGVAGYAGHYLDDISPLFPALNCYLVDSKYEVSRSIHRVVGAHLAISYMDGPLNYNATLRSRLSDFFEAGSRHIPYSIALQGLLSFSWSGLFVELYRCIEQLYAVPRLLELTREWTTKLSLHDVAELMERTLSWRPKEDESLIKLLQQGCSLAALNSISQALSSPTSTDTAHAAEIAARAIYRSRNSFVHFRPSKSESYLSEKEWNCLIGAMLVIIDELYTKFGRRFHSATA